MSHDASDAPSPLHARLAALLDPLGGSTALAARRTAPAVEQANASAYVIALRADLPLPAADLAYLPIALEFERRADLGQFARTEEWSLAGAPRDAAFGPLAALSDGLRCTLDDLATLMLLARDATAARALVGLLGAGEVNHTASRLHLTQTRLAQGAQHATTTTAGEMETLLGLLQGGAFPGARRLVGLLEQQQGWEDLRVAWLPPSARLAHLSTLTATEAHSAGVLSGPGGRCRYCVLTATTTPAAARHAVCQVVRALWEEWCAEAPAGDR